MTLGSKFGVYFGDLGSPNVDFGDHLAAFSGPLGSTLAVFGWLGADFGDSLSTFVGNVVSSQMLSKLLFFVGFSWVGGCLEGPGWSLWVVLAASAAVGRHPQAQLRGRTPHPAPGPEEGKMLGRGRYRQGNRFAGNSKAVTPASKIASWKDCKAVRL